MKTPDQEKINNAMAPMALKTFGMPFAFTQAGNAKTKIVLKVFLRNVTAVSESPTISGRHCQYEP